MENANNKHRLASAYQGKLKYLVSFTYRHLRIFPVKYMQVDPSPLKKSRFDFWSKQLRNVLKRMKNYNKLFSDFF